MTLWTSKAGPPADFPPDQLLEVQGFREEGNPHDRLRHDGAECEGGTLIYATVRWLIEII
jgi:hypothetical protein